MIFGYSLTYEEDESVVDTVAEAAHKCFIRMGKSSTLAHVPRTITDEEEEAILKSGCVKQVKRTHNIRFVIVGFPTEDQRGLKDETNNG